MPDNEDVTPASRSTAIVLILAVVAMMAVIAHHPVARGTTDSLRLASVIEQGGAAQAVHGSVMVFLLLLGAVMTRFSQMLGLNRPTVLVALLAYLASIPMGFIAMSFDGFVIPAVAQGCASAGTECLGSAMTMFKLAAICVQVFTRIALFLMVGATALWSSVAIRQGNAMRVVGGVGLAAAALQVALLAGPSAHLTPHTLLMVLAGQLLWYAALAWLFLTSAHRNRVRR